jgi:hypothetical protein
MSITTKSGDDGTTGLWSGERVPKDDPRIEACGEVDELSSLLGFARLACRPAGDARCPRGPPAGPRARGGRDSLRRSGLRRSHPVLGRGGHHREDTGPRGARSPSGLRPARPHRGLGPHRPRADRRAQARAPGGGPRSPFGSPAPRRRSRIYCADTSIGSPTTSSCSPGLKRRRRGKSNTLDRTGDLRCSKKRDATAPLSGTCRPLRSSCRTSCRRGPPRSSISSRRSTSRRP